MNINRYLFQSPYSSQVQIGRPDPSVKTEENTQKGGSELTKNTNQTLKEAQTFQTSQVSEVKPKVESSSAGLDIYA